MEDQQTEHRGLIVTIDDKGMIKLQSLGSINNAEFLGIGAYITSTPLRDGISAVLRNQMLTGDSLRGMTEILQQMNGEESCGKDSFSEQLPSSASGPSTENSPEVSDE